MTNQEPRDGASTDETEIRALIARSAEAVREWDLVMFDAPPFLSRGLDAIRKTGVRWRGAREHHSLPAA